MVDLNTAMSAASVDRQKRVADEGKERMKRRSGRDLGIEAFDPVKHVSKEKAETASMWLVIVFSVVVSLLMRYVLMPRTTVAEINITEKEFAAFMETDESLVELEPELFVRQILVEEFLGL